MKKPLFFGITGSERHTLDALDSFYDQRGAHHQGTGVAGGKEGISFSFGKQFEANSHGAVGF